MIQINRYTELPCSIKNEISQTIENEFGHIPLVKKTIWAVPHWTIIAYSDSQLASFYNIIQRICLFDNRPFFVAGISNVITLPQFRGKGLSTNLLKKTENFFFDELQMDAGLLLCAEQLIPFYQRLNWHLVTCPIYFEQPGGKTRWKAAAMLRFNDVILEPIEISLNGLPW